MRNTPPFPSFSPFLLPRDGKHVHDDTDPPTPAESIAPSSPTAHEVPLFDGADPVSFYMTLDSSMQPSMDQTDRAISEDILRTLPSLCVFQPVGPMYASLL